MEKYRRVIAYKEYFEVFLDSLTPKVQAKVLQILRIVENVEVVPGNYLKHIEGTDGLYEIRIGFANLIFRVFCFFDSDKLVILLSGFQKKSQKTPKREIDRALSLMQDYINEKNNENDKTYEDKNAV